MKNYTVLKKDEDPKGLSNKIVNFIGIIMSISICLAAIFFFHLFLGK